MPQTMFGDPVETPASGGKTMFGDPAESAGAGAPAAQKPTDQGVLHGLYTNVVKPYVDMYHQASDAQDASNKAEEGMGFGEKMLHRAKEGLSSGLQTAFPALNIAQAQAPMFKKAYDAANDTTKTPLQRVAGTVGYGAAGLLPGTGPMAAHAGETAAEGKPREATGEMLGTLGQTLLPKAIENARPIAATIGGGIKGGIQSLKPMDLSGAPGIHPIIKSVATKIPVPAPVAGGMMGAAGARALGVSPTAGAAVGALAPIVKGIAEGGREGLSNFRAANAPKIIGNPAWRNFQSAPEQAEPQSLQPTIASAKPTVSLSGRTPGGIHNQVADEPIVAAKEGTPSPELKSLKDRTKTGTYQPEPGPNATTVTIDPARFKEAYEKGNGEPLAWSPERTSSLKSLPEGTDTGTPEIGLGPNGRPGVTDGRHRIALAAEQGKPIQVSVEDPAVAKQIQERFGATEQPTTLQPSITKPPVSSLPASLGRNIDKNSAISYDLRTKPITYEGEGGENLEGGERGRVAEHEANAEALVNRAVDMAKKQNAFKSEEHFNSPEGKEIQKDILTKASKNGKRTPTNQITYDKFADRLFPQSAEKPNPVASPPLETEGSGEPSAPEPKLSIAENWYKSRPPQPRITKATPEESEAARKGSPSEEAGMTRADLAKMYDEMETRRGVLPSGVKDKLIEALQNAGPAAKPPMTNEEIVSSLPNKDQAAFKYQMENPQGYRIGRAKDLAQAVQDHREYLTYQKLHGEPMQEPGQWDQRMRGKFESDVVRDAYNEANKLGPYDSEEAQAEFEKPKPLRRPTFEQALARHGIEDPYIYRAEDASVAPSSLRLRPMSTQERLAMERNHGRTRP